MSEKKIVASGKRKSAVARAMIFGGSGKVTLNKKDLGVLHEFDRLKMEEPLRIAQKVLGSINFDCEIDVHGGGEKGQVEAARLALARAILKFSKNKKELEEAFLTYGWDLLVADTRRKETYKPGDSKARSKRQTSYR